MVELTEQQFWVVKNAAGIFRRCVVDALLAVLLFYQFLLLTGDLGELVVKVVAIELLLRRVSPQVLRIFFEFRVIQIFPFFVDVFGVEVVFQGRNERRSDPLVLQVIPRKVFKPRVVFDFVGSVVSKPVLGFPLDHFVDEVSSFDRPVSWNFAFFNLNLFLKDVIPDLLSGLANIRSSSEHAFVGHDSDCKVIDAGGVVDSAHDFGSHVAGRA